MIDPRIRLALLSFARRQSRRLPDKLGHIARASGKLILDYRGARSHLSRSVTYSVLRNYSRLLVAPFGQAELLVDSNDREVGRVVFIQGNYERIYMAAALAHLDAAGIPYAGKLFVDIGANIGTSTVDALVNFEFGRAVCFEPDRRNFKLLSLNLLLNDLQERVVALPIAISDSGGAAILEQSPSNFGDSRISKAGPQSASGGGMIRCRSFDSFVEDGLLPVDEIGLLWIDTQGHEAAVLTGASSALEAGVPTVLEYWPDGLEEHQSLRLLEDLIRQHYRRVIDLRLACHGVQAEAEIDASDIGQLATRYQHGDHTDLLLIR